MLKVEISPDQNTATVDALDYSFVESGCRVEDCRFKCALRSKKICSQIPCDTRHYGLSRNDFKNGIFELKQ